MDQSDPRLVIRRGKDGNNEDADVQPTGWKWILFIKILGCPFLFWGPSSRLVVVFFFFFFFFFFCFFFRGSQFSLGGSRPPSLNSQAVWPMVTVTAGASEAHGSRPKGPAERLTEINITFPCSPAREFNKGRPKHSR